MAQFAFDATVIYWRGPAPFFYAPVPPAEAEEIRRASRLVSYGWGVIPVEATIGGVTFTTSLFPKNGTYLVPLKDAVRKPSGITADDTIHIELTLRPRR
jgi:hypothetical protein